MSDLIQLQPQDEHNQKLEWNVRPPDWKNPTPAGRYNLVVIGAGTAGLVTAAGAAGLGAKVALVEPELMGGDCLNVGCVPSKAVISAAHIAATVREAGEFGIEVPRGANVNFAAAMQRMRMLRAGIIPNDSAARFRDLGVDVFLGNGPVPRLEYHQRRRHELALQKGGDRNGARAAAPPIPGLDQVDYLTNESVFSLTALPVRLGVIGAGPIGCELSQSFAQLGAVVFLVKSDRGILPREDRDAARIVEARMLRDGVQMLVGGRETAVKNGGRQIHLTADAKQHRFDEPIDQLLVAVGRASNVENLSLDAVGVKFDQKGVKVNDRLQTTNPRIFAAGDVCSPYQFTHAANFMARIVIQNALFQGRAKASTLTIPWCTYTTPEVAYVGLSGQDAMGKGVEIDTFVQEMKDVDRAILEGEDEGFVKVHVHKGSDRIAGATIVARNAGDMISEITLAMTHGLGVKSIASTIHPYPTQAEAIGKVGDMYNRTRLTPFVKSLFHKWLNWTR